MNYQVEYRDQNWIAADIEAPSPAEAAKLYLRQDSERKWQDYEEIVVFWGLFGRHSESFRVRDFLPSSGSEPPEKAIPDTLVPTPEGVVGTTISNADGTWRVEGIEAIGSKFVVFRLLNLKTGQVDRVLKVHHSEFDPATPLAEAMIMAMQDLSRDPDRVIRICDRLLALSPMCEAAAFNKGVALLSKNEAGPAEEAFALARKLAPDDLLNFVHQAACLARLERDAEVLSVLMAAKAAGSGEVQRALLIVPLHAKSIQLALRRLVDGTQNKQEAKDALRTCFGLSVRLRLLFWRFSRTSIHD